jgi:hypothetical protein
MRHIKPYAIFEGDSQSDYTILGIYGHRDKKAALAKLREIGMQLIADNLKTRYEWNTYFPDEKLVILGDPTGEPMITSLPDKFEKRVQRMINGDHKAVALDTRPIRDPEKLRKISSAISHFSSDDYIISHIKANPMDQDLLDGHPRRDELIQRSGVKDVSDLARSMRSGLT